MKLYVFNHQMEKLQTIFLATTENTGVITICDLRSSYIKELTKIEATKDGAQVLVGILLSFQ